MKLCYGYYHETTHQEQTILAEKPAIKDFVESLMQKYDWVTILDNSGNDVTCEYC